jgi:hypothetical protein
MYFIAAGTVELEVTDSLTLKDKRQVVKALVDRLRSRFNLAVAEVGHLDSRCHATLALSAVANDQSLVHAMLEKAIDLIESEPRAVVLDYSIEML